MALKTELIRGKVARILSTREVALNVGEQDGVETGMIFDILSPKGSAIPDPETGTELGSVDLPKVRIKITRVYEKLSVASTYRSKQVNVGGGSGLAGIGSLFVPPKWETHYETLKSKESFESGAEDLNEVDSYVSTGDSVVQVVSDDHVTLG